MSNFSQNNRWTKEINNFKMIKNIIIKYIDIKNLNIKSSDTFKEMIIHDYLPDIGTFLISYKNTVHTEKLDLYTVIAGRYMEFNLELFRISCEGYPEGSREYKVVSCKLAASMREKERFDVNDMPYIISKLTFPKIRETKKELIDNLSTSIIIKTCIKKIKGFSLKEYYDIQKNSNSMNKDIMPEMAYALEAGGLYIKNLSHPEIFFKESQNLFKRTRVKDLEKKLRSRIQDLSKDYISLLIKPIEYITTMCDFITLGYVILGTKERVIDDGKLKKINIALLQASQILKYGNYTTLKYTGNILDISENGILVEFQDKELIKYIVEHEAIMFDLILGKFGLPLHVSGIPVYILSLDNGIHHVGINFQGSQFGPELKRQMLLHLKRDFKYVTLSA